MVDAEVTWYMDGAVSFDMDSGGRGATTETQIVWAEALPPGTSAQRAENLIALTKALQLGKGQKLNIITDSLIRPLLLLPTYTEPSTETGTPHGRG